MTAGKKAALTSLVGWFKGRSLPVRSEALEPGIDEIDVAQLTTRLGLSSGGRPIRESPAWRRPRRVLVMECPAWRLAWLQRSVPDVELHSPASRAETDRLVERADAVIGWWNVEMLERGRHLSWLHFHKAGVDELIGAAEIDRRRIVVTTPKGVAAPVIADHVFAMLLTLVRRVDTMRQSSQVEIDGTTLGTLFGKTLFVAGAGRIGTEVVRRAQAFGMQVIAMRRSAGPRQDGVDHVIGPTGLLDHIGSADVIVNALPLTDATRDLFDRRAFAACRRGAIFVNVGRGGSVATPALVDALQSGHLGGAALDVTEPEPLPASHPLRHMQNVVLTPHVAAWSVETRAWMWLLARENLRRFVDGGVLLSVLDLARGY